MGQRKLPGISSIASVHDSKDRPLHSPFARLLSSPEPVIEPPEIALTFARLSAPDSRSRRAISIHRYASCLLALGLMLSLLALNDLARSPARAALANRVYLGAAGDAEVLRTKTSHPFGDHDYAKLEGSIPQARMITVNSSHTWRQIANAQPGSTIHSDLVRWGRTLKDRGPVFLAYSHEPETSGNVSKGNAADFKAAYRKVVQVVRAQGATNVSFTWQMTAWAFRAPSTSRVYAAKWYPGDSYVDVVGADAYNWHTCGEGQGRWAQLSTVAGGGLAFAKSHGKQFALPEFAAHRDSRRAAWLDSAHEWIRTNKGTFAAAYYFNRPPTNSSNRDCDWSLATDADYRAIGRIAGDGALFTV